MRFHLNYLFLTIPILWITSCEPIDSDNINWKPDVLAPVAKSNVDLYDFEELIFSNANYNVQAGDLDIPGYVPGVPVAVVPPISNKDLPPEYLPLSNFFNRVAIDSAKVGISFNNVFPIDIDPPTKLVIRDSITQELIGEHIITRRVKPEEFYSFNLEFQDKIASKTLQIRVEDFTSPGGVNAFFEEETLIINVNIQFVRMKYVEIINDVSYSDTSFSDVDFDLNDDGIVDALNGGLSLFIENNFPSVFNLQLDFYDDNQNLVYSLFGTDGVVIEKAITNNSGNVIESTKLELIDFVDTDELPLIENSRKLRVVANFLSGPTPAINIEDESSYIELIMTADAEIDVLSID